MKKRKTNYENSFFTQQSRERLTLFFIFFCVYTFLGMCISYATTFETNLFFGADNYRAFLDIAVIEDNHYRIQVHPLFLILVQPITLILNGIVNDAKMSVILLESFAGACSVVFLHKILQELNVEEKLKRVFAAIYGCSFSLLIYSSVPETFILTGLSLISFWYFILKAVKEKRYDKYVKILLVFFGIVSFGMTLTNYVAFVLGYALLLLICFEKLGDQIKEFFRLNIIIGILVLILCFLQKFIWGHCPIFVKSIIKGLLGQGYEETMYMNFSVSLEKTAVWFKEIFTNSFISQNVSWKGTGVDAYIGFESYGILQILVVTVLVGILFLSVASFVKTLLKKGWDDIKKYEFVLMLAFVENCLLHYIYGSREAFMYTPHFLYLLLILGAVGLNEIRAEKLKTGASYILWIVVCFEFVNNMLIGIKTSEMALENVKKAIPWTYAVAGTALVGVLCYIGIRFLKRVQKGSVAAMVLAPWQDEFKVMVRNIQIYAVMIFLCGVFVSFNYDGIAGFIGVLFRDLTALMK